MGKILVTGGTGFIGSHTCVALTNAGYPVVVMDNLSNSKVEAIARIEMITGNTCGFTGRICGTRQTWNRSLRTTRSTP